jgi:hypothetical protein
VLQPFYVLRVKSKTINSANQVMESHKAEADGFITDVMVGGTAADAKILYVKSVETWYFVHDANDSDSYGFKTPIPVKRGDDIKVVSLTAAVGTHYAFVYGYKL